MKAAARLLVILAAVWGGSFLIQTPACAEYYTGAAARAFLKAQDARQREQARVVVVYELPGGAACYIPYSPEPGYASAAWDDAEAYWVPHGSSAAASFGDSSWWGGRALTAPYSGSFSAAGGSSFSEGAVSAGYWGASRAFRSGLASSWVYGPRVPSHFYFSNRGLLAFGTGRFAMRIGW